MTKPLTAAQQMYQALQQAADILARNRLDDETEEAFNAACQAIAAYEAHLRTYAARMQTIQQARRDKHTRRPCTCGAADELHHLRKCPAFWSIPARRARLAARKEQGE